MTTPDPAPDERARAAPDQGAEPDLRKRPLVERIGLAVIALVFASLFAFVAVAAFTGGELFLAVMGAVGAVMVLWVAGLGLVRG